MVYNQNSLFHSRKKQQQQIYEDINDLFKLIIRKKDSKQLKQYLTFVKNNPHQAPFNNTLVFTQRPTCVYYMTADQWLKIHNRTIKPQARPMVILFPFGPVKFVYNYTDTEGENDLDQNSFITWWKEEKSNSLSLETFDRTTMRLAKKYQIPFVWRNADNYFSSNSLSTGGYAKGYKTNNKSEITLHPQYRQVISSNINEAYGVLVHEIAHIFLGHLGSKHYFVVKKGDKTQKTLCEDRSHLVDSMMELEAELTAWLVFNRLGINKNSVEYMAMWLIKIDDLQDLDISRVLRISNTIFEMRK